MLRIAAVTVLAHQGGWDETLMVLTPIAVFALLLKLANGRASRAQAAATAAAAATPTGSPGGPGDGDGEPTTDPGPTAGPSTGSDDRGPVSPA